MENEMAKDRCKQLNMINNRHMETGIKSRLSHKKIYVLEILEEILLLYA